jgi:1-deoxy-D-xylulose-5-phosphate reductoisomerase
MRKMNAKKVTILGSTGSIGTSALDVVLSHPGKFDIIALGAGRNVELLADQIRRFRPRLAIVYSESEAAELKKIDPLPDLEIMHGQEGLKTAASLPDNDIVLNALVGAAGLLASLETVRAGKYLALANKESLVAGGPLFEKESAATGAKILPVDSEHSAIWQCLNAGRKSEVKRIILTASGGPFRDRDPKTFADITPKEALAHPTWTMGRKITIDSATMMNKGLELIEAVWLFSVAPDKIRIVIHPQSIVHSMVEYVDSSIIAQMSFPDMKLPIAYALFWPDRQPSSNGQVDLASVGQLTFSEPDEVRFPALQLARMAAERGGTAPAVLNAANEIAVEHFLEGRIGFSQITELAGKILVNHNVIADPGLDDILNSDREARRLANEEIGKT